MDFDSFENYVYELSMVMWGFENHDNNDAFKSMFFETCTLHTKLFEERV